MSRFVDGVLVAGAGAAEVVASAFDKTPPPGTYYILSLKECPDGRLLWWSPACRGYTTIVNNAGVYTEQEVAEDEGHFSNGWHTLAIPVSEVRAMLGEDGRVLKRHLRSLRRKRRPIGKAALATIAAWNDKHREGKAVLVGGVPAKLASYAFLASEGTVVAVVIRDDLLQEDRKTFVRLDRVTFGRARSEAVDHG